MNPSPLFGQMVHRTALLLIVCMSLAPLGVLAQDEPSPIEIELLAPQQAQKGETIDVLIRYDVVDPNANAKINYDVLGPCAIRSRAPEPPDPTVNIWIPTGDSAPGTIRIQVQIDKEATDLQVRHVVKVRWGDKVRTFESDTAVQAVPPTPTAAPVPALPAEGLSSSAVPTLNLVSVGLSHSVSGGGNQEVALQVSYVSTGDLRDVIVTVRFDPDVVNLEEAARAGRSYEIAVPFLPRAPGSRPLFDLPLRGRIRPYQGGGEHYGLQAIVQIVTPDGATRNVPGPIVSQPVGVDQDISVVVQSRVDSEVAPAGRSIIVHVVCENLGQLPVEDLTVRIEGLPEGFVTHPLEQIIDQIAGVGGFEERLFAIRTPGDVEQTVTFRAVVTVDQTVIESEPVTVETALPTSLELELSADKSTVLAGDALTVRVACTNGGYRRAGQLTAKLIDSTGNLGTFLKDLSDIEPGKFQEVVFVIEVPPDFPVDAVSLLRAQLVSEGEALAESAPLSVRVACVPEFEVLLRSPGTRVESGGLVEFAASVRNVSQCTARDIRLSLEGLPDGFPVPPDQEVDELPPGAARNLTFSSVVPDGYQGKSTTVVHLVDRMGTNFWSEPSDLAVGAVSLLFVVGFGLLGVLAFAAATAGFVLFLRQR
ncbi:MAG: hypothetical protein ISS56_06795 [Anaerolineae bacterium]|nr:hypothetical protein [Anaerolineae bacterium]